MVSKQTIKEYDFNDIFEYYYYILESEANGQRKQVYDLIKRLSKEQKKEAYQYFNDFDSNIAKEVQRIIYLSI